MSLYLATLTIRLPIVAEGGLTIRTDSLSNDEPEQIDEAGHARHVTESMLGYLYESYDRAVAGGSASGCGRVIGFDVVVDRVERLAPDGGFRNPAPHLAHPDYTHVCPVCLLATRGEETCAGGTHLGDPPAHAPVQTQPRDIHPDYTHKCPICRLLTRSEETCEGPGGEQWKHPPIQTQPRNTA